MGDKSDMKGHGKVLITSLVIGLVIDKLHKYVKEIVYFWHKLFYLFIFSYNSAIHVQMRSCLKAYGLYNPSHNI